MFFINAFFQCIIEGLAVVVACYLQNIERKPVRPSIRITVNRLLNDSDIDEAFATIERVANKIVL